MMDYLGTMVQSELNRLAAQGHPSRVTDANFNGRHEYPAGVVILTFQVTLKPEETATEPRQRTLK
jgi:hypothetical protein